MRQATKRRLKDLLVSLCARIIECSKEPQSVLEEIVAELRRRSDPSGAFAALHAVHNGPAYLAPTDLSRTEFTLRRALVVGSCLAEAWVRDIDCPADFVLVNNLSVLPDEPPRAATEYDVQIVQLPLRIPLPEAHLWQLSHLDEAGHEAAFAVSVQRLHDALELACSWNRRYGLLTLVTNFLVPQQNAMGRTVPRYDLRNPAYFVERLNAALAAALERFENAYLLDIDGLACVYGRRYLQDDAFNALAHGTLWGNDPHSAIDARRIEPFPSVAEHYKFTPREEFFASAWRQVVAMVRTLRRYDEVKLVIVDLDDTLWRGVAGEDSTDTVGMTEGWPLGLMEALAYLKKRGVLLAIVSKNEQSRIEALWGRLMRGGLQLDDFAVRQINWRSKIENVNDVLDVVNVLPKNVVFIDDNPAERAAVAAAFPDIRTLGAYPLYLRRILLWSSETQVESVTAESARRTELVQTQVQRERERTQFSREDFLSSLALEVDVFNVADRTDPRFDRLLELINKTNQFNTTGVRRQREEFTAGDASGLRLYGFAARDRFSDYGVVGAALLRANSIEQFVMSCRVIGLDVENAVVGILLSELRTAGFVEAQARAVDSEANFPSRDLYARCGFVKREGTWFRVTSTNLPTEVVQGAPGPPRNRAEP